MARVAEKEKARALRAKGKSYSEIKQLLNISKGTLSGWLNDMPLSARQIRLLRDLNPRRIENFRETMRKKREHRLEIAYQQVAKDIGRLSKRDLFIAGFYLYWGEGIKSARGNVGVANTDPAVIRAFIDWMHILGISKERMYVRLHLYKDMDTKKEMRFWSREIIVPVRQFRKPFIKNSLLTGLTYKTGFGHGTCNIGFENVPQWEYIMMALRYLRERHTRP